MVTPRTCTVIVAAGSGSRFGGALAKQFCLLAGRPMLMHTIDAFRNALPDGEVVVVLAEAMMGEWQRLCDEYGYTSPRVVAGGDTRWASVRNAIDVIDEADIVLVHDAARPLVSADIIARAVAAAAANGAAIPVVPVTDSLRDADGHAVDRARFRAVQTPQAFAIDVIRHAYTLPWQPSFTDDASVAEAAGHPIATTDGHPTNIKITYPADLAVAEALMALQK